MTYDFKLGGYKKLAKKIIGLAGGIGSGKTSVAGYLEGRGFHQLRFSKPIQEEAKKRGLPPERKVYQDIGDEWRVKFGLEYIGGLILKEVEASPDELFVVEGFRNLGDLAPFEALPGFS